LKLATILEPKFKRNWAKGEIVNELKDSLKTRLSELIIQKFKIILAIIVDDFLHFDAISNSVIEKLQKVFNEYSNLSSKLPRISKRHTNIIYTRGGQTVHHNQPVNHGRFKSRSC